MDREQYDKVCASLAGSRSLAVLRKGFEIKVDLKKIWDDYVVCKSFCLEGLAMKQLTSGLEEVDFVTKDADAWQKKKPDVEPTNKHIEVALVVIVCIRGGKLYHEHIYWKQASVLVQIDLLDPKLVTGGKGQGRLPVVDGA
ncbi:MAG: hypothetical protein Q9175_000040 [Cornicularia normoerica]